IFRSTPTARTLWWRSGVKRCRNAGF
ncbi:hypothetical protein D041_0133C, partial [Vibrio parahaemolyticus EKP-008]